jgi:hypothetical protein
VLGSHSGHEPNDPARIAQAILAVADHPEPPLQLLLGADAMLYATRQLSAFQAEIGRWAPLTLSTGYPNE